MAYGKRYKSWNKKKYVKHTPTKGNKLDLSDSRVKKEITGLLWKFEQPNSLEFMAKAMFKKGIDIPSDNWSFLNRLIMHAHKSVDARGYKAWGEVGRKCEKGAGFYILAPKMRTITKEDDKGEEKKIKICCGFYPIIVWPIEGTEGEPVDYKTEPMPDFECMAVADKLNIKVEQSFENMQWNGYFDQDAGENGKIVMATSSQQTFFHELCHAVHNKIKKEKTGSGLKGGQDAGQEIIAEFSACVLMAMFGLKASTKSAYEYIEKYSKKQKKKTIRGIADLLPKMEKIITYIVETNNACIEEA